MGIALPQILCVSQALSRSGGAAPRVAKNRFSWPATSVGREISAWGVCGSYSNSATTLDLVALRSGTDGCSQCHLGMDCYSYAA